jgi:hypothetical protein
VCVCNHSQPVFGLGGSSDSATMGATMFFVLPLDGATANGIAAGGCSASSTVASVSSFVGRRFTTDSLGGSQLCVTDWVWLER